MNTIKSISEKLKKKEVTSTEITQEYFKNIKSRNEDIKAYITLLEESALTQSKLIDDKRIKGKALSDIAGIPCAIKDNINVKDSRLTASSRILEDYISPFNATVVDKLEDSIILGKTNLDSFAFGSSTENSGYFTTKNPWDLSKSPGGSSGGSVASVASDMSIFALGTDTGGSVRQPSAFCGVVGLKPTYGRCSRYGLLAMGSSLDCPGPITKTVEDAAIVLKHMAGPDDYDATCVDRPIDDYTNFKDIKGLKVGVPKEFFSDDLVKGIETGVKENVMDSIKLLENLGAEIIEISLPTSIYSLPVYYIITPSEIATNMARYDGIRFGNSPTDPKDLMDIYISTRQHFEDEVKRRVFIGNYSLSSGYYDAYYNKAMQVRTLILNEIKEAFEKVDVIVSPTTPTTAFKTGEFADNPLLMYLGDIFTVTANIAGIPAISIPCGISNGLPVGFQIMGKHFDEAGILNVANALEAEIKFNEKYQPVILRT